MCRWVVYVGTKVLLADILVRPRHSLVCQTHERYLPNCTTQWTMANMVSMIKRNAAVNADGFGVGWYNLEVDPEPCIFTSIAPAEHNVNLSRLSKKIQSHLIFGHVRAASPGSPVNDTNCHPFQFGRYLWMHNGCIANWSAVKRPLSALLSSCSFAFVSGTTDSELAGALFVDQLPNHDPYTEHSPQEIAEAMRRTIQIITQMVHSLHLPGSGVSTVSSLNFAVSDGKTVVATRYRDSPTEEPPSLYYCQVTKMEMVADEMEFHHDASSPPKGVVIASEPLTYQSENWTLVPKNYMLIVTEGTVVEQQPIITTSEIVPSRWIQEAETARHSNLHHNISDLYAFFSTPCCQHNNCSSYAQTESSPADAVGPLSHGHITPPRSAPSSPPIGRHYSPNTKSAMILESPIMTGALRALLASATPSQLREILTSNLLPCPSSSGSNGLNSSTNLRKSSSLGLTAPAAGTASTAAATGGSAAGSNGSAGGCPLDYASLAHSLSTLNNGSSCSTSPSSSSPSSLAPPETFPFLRRGESPVILQTVRSSPDSSLKPPVGRSSSSSSQTNNTVSNLTSSTSLVPPPDISFSPANSCSDLPIIPSSH